MEWLIAALIVVPALAGLGWASIHVKRSLDQRRLAAMDPRGASLVARIEAVADRLLVPSLLSRLPGPVVAELRGELRQLARRKLPAIIAERGTIISSGDVTLAHSLRSSELELEAFVADLERLERTLLSRAGDGSRTSDLLRSSGEAVVVAQLVADEIARLDWRPDPKILSLASHSLSVTSRPERLASKEV